MGAGRPPPAPAPARQAGTRYGPPAAHELPHSHAPARVPELRRADSERSHSQFEEVDLQSMQNGDGLGEYLGEEETLYAARDMQRGIELPLEADGEEEDAYQQGRPATSSSHFQLPLTINSAQSAYSSAAGAYAARIEPGAAAGPSLSDDGSSVEEGRVETVPRGVQGRGEGGERVVVVGGGELGDASAYAADAAGDEAEASEPRDERLDDSPRTHLAQAAGDEAEEAIEPNKKKDEAEEAIEPNKRRSLDPVGEPVRAELEGVVEGARAAEEEEEEELMEEPVCPQKEEGSARGDVAVRAGGGGRRDSGGGGEEGRGGGAEAGGATCNPGKETERESHDACPSESEDDGGVDRDSARARRMADPEMGTGASLQSHHETPVSS